MTAQQPTTPDVVSSLDAVLDELAEKLEPADVAALATAAKQDAAKAALDAINAALATLNLDLDTVEPKLQAIADALGNPLLVGSAPATAASEPGDTATVDDTTSTLFAAKADRRFLSVSNPDGPGDLWLTFGAGPAVVGSGQWVPAGSYWEMPTDAPVASAVQAISTVDGTDVGIVEW